MTHYGILALWAVNGLSIVCWELRNISINQVFPIAFMFLNELAAHFAKYLAQSLL